LYCCPTVRHNTAVPTIVNTGMSLRTAHFVSAEKQRSSTFRNSAVFWFPRVEMSKLLAAITRRRGATSTANCTYNVTLKCIRVLLPWKSIAYSECVCSLRHPSCKAHAPSYIVISGSTISFHLISYTTRDFRHYHIFPPYLIHDTRFSALSY
jgi:hypothetical protein